MANKNVRVDIPTNPAELIALALKLKKQDEALGAASPLKTIKNWANFAALATTADTQQTQADQLSKQAETATENREIALGNDGPLRENTVRFFVLAGRDLLLGANKGNEHVLGDYGFVVDSSPSAASLAKKAAKAKKTGGA
jgi:hypothetical protein